MSVYTSPTLLFTTIRSVYKCTSPRLLCPAGMCQAVGPTVLRPSDRLAAPRRTSWEEMPKPDQHKQTNKTKQTGDHTKSDNVITASVISCLLVFMPLLMSLFLLHLKVIKTSTNWSAFVLVFKRNFLRPLLPENGNVFALSQTSPKLSVNYTQTSNFEKKNKQMNYKAEGGANFWARKIKRIFKWEANRTKIHSQIN